MAQFEIDSRPEPINFGAGRNDIARVVQNCKNLLMCRKGEVPFDRQRGFDPALFDLPMNELREALMQELDRMLFWEVRADVASADAYLDETGHVVIHCVLEVQVD